MAVFTDDQPDGLNHYLAPVWIGVHNFSPPLSLQTHITQLTDVHVSNDVLVGEVEKLGRGSG